MKNLGWLVVPLTALAIAAAISASGQTRASYAAAMVRPRLEDQFGFDAPRWQVHRGPGLAEDLRGDDGPGARRPHGPGPEIAPDLIVYNCLSERQPLELAIRRLRPFGTLKLIGTGPSCTLVTSLRLNKPVRIAGEKDAMLIGPSGAPCVVVEPDGSAAIADVRLRSWSHGDQPCVSAQGADVSLERLAIETHGTAVAVRGGRLSLREVHLSGGPAPVLRLEHAEFAIVKASVETFGDGAQIIPPQSGIAQLDHVDFTAHGRHGVGLTLRSDGAPGARVVLDSVKLEGFVGGLVAGVGTRSVATHLHIGHAEEVGVEVTGAGLDLSNSVIEAGQVGIRLSGYVPGAPGDAPRILDNEIAARGIAGIYVADGAPGEARNNSIRVQLGRCIVGFSRSGDFRERANLCHPL